MNIKEISKKIFDANRGLIERVPLESEKGKCTCGHEFVEPQPQPCVCSEDELMDVIR